MLTIPRPPQKQRLTSPRPLHPGKDDRDRMALSAMLAGQVPTSVAGIYDRQLPRSMPDSARLR